MQVVAAPGVAAVNTVGFFLPDLLRQPPMTLIFPLVVPGMPYPALGLRMQMAAVGRLSFRQTTEQMVAVEEQAALARRHVLTEERAALREARLRAPAVKAAAAQQVLPE